MNNDWDDIRFVLAVADTGSLNAAAQRLGVTHATVMRRVGSFEQRHGRQVFERTQSGYNLLPDAKPIIDAARSVEDAILSIDHAIIGTDSTLRGTVRIGSTDSVCLHLLPNIIHSISTSYPELSLILLSDNSRHDLYRMTSDIAVRLSPSLSDGLYGQQAGVLEFAVYQSQQGSSEWLGVTTPLENSAAAKWMNQNVAPDQIRHRTNSFLLQKEYAAAGLGRAYLPRFIADDDPRLVKVKGDFPPISFPVWVAMLEELANNLRFRTVQEIILLKLREVLPRYTS